MKGIMTSVAKTSEHQTAANWLFLPTCMAIDFKVAQFLSSNLMPSFSNIWVLFTCKNYQRHTIERKKKDLIVDFRVKWVIDIDCSPGHLNP